MAQKLDMKDRFNSPVQEIIGEVHDLLNDEIGIDEHHKSRIKSLLNQADFLIGRYDERYEKFDKVLLAMATLDFSHKLAVDNADEEPFFTCLSNALNMLNEEFYHVVLSKNLVQTAFRTLSLPNSIVIITDAKGKIKFLSNEIDPSKGLLASISGKILEDQNINLLFDEYSIIERQIEQKASIQNISVKICWEGRVVPAELTVSVANSKGRVDGLVYVIKA